MQRTIIRAGLAAAAFSALSACSSLPENSGVNVVRNLVMYGGTTVPPPRVEPRDEAYCPTVDIFEGGAALRAIAGRDATAVRHQISLGQVARECTPRPDGSVVVKIGVEGRVLLGAGSGGRFTAPVRFVIKRGTTVIASRTRSVAVPIEPGQTQGFFNVVEGGFVVPPQDAQDYDIEVGLGSPGSGEPSARRARR